jgi:hypothetical protein
LAFLRSVSKYNPENFGDRKMNKNWKNIIVLQHPVARHLLAKVTASTV